MYILQVQLHDFAVAVDGVFPRQGAITHKRICCVSRKCAVAAGDSCTNVAHCAHLHAPHHPWLGTPGVSAVSVLLHRYGDISDCILPIKGMSQ